MLFLTVMPVVAPPLGIVVAYHPLPRMNIGKRIFQAVRLIF